MAADITKQEFGIYGFVLRVRRIGVFEIPAKGVQFLSSPDLDLSREGGRFAVAAAVSRRNVTRFVFRNTLCCHQIGHGNELHYFLARPETTDRTDAIAIEADEDDDAGKFIPSGNGSRRR